MPKMRILSGTQAGAVVEMDLPEAQNAYCTGYAELYVEPEKPARPAKVEKPKVEDKPKGQKKGA